MAYETIANVPMMSSSPEERLFYAQLQANAKKKAALAQRLKDYRKNPGKYSADQRMFMEQQAMEAGLPMPDSKVDPLKVGLKGLAAAADTALLGMLPNELYTPLNQAERVATGIGGLAGYAVPFGLPAKIARGGLAAMRGTKMGEKFAKGFSGGPGGRFAQAFGWPFGKKAPKVTVSPSQKVAQKAADKVKRKFVSSDKVGARFNNVMKDPKMQASLRDFLNKNGATNANAIKWAQQQWGKEGTNPNVWAALGKFFNSSKTPFGKTFWSKFAQGAPQRPSVNVPNIPVTGRLPQGQVPKRLPPGMDMNMLNAVRFNQPPPRIQGLLGGSRLPQLPGVRPPMGGPGMTPGAPMGNMNPRAWAMLSPEIKRQLLAGQRVGGMTY